MDPSVLYASPQRIRSEVASVLESYGGGSGLVFNLGHGIAQDTDPDHVAVLVDSVHELSPSYQSKIA
jgi:uroporphyrinogen decarboxylase